MTHLALACAFLFLLPPGALGAARVELGSDVVAVGEIARVPITLDTDGGKVTTITDDVTVPAALVFEDAELGEAGTAAAATVDTKLSGASGDAVRTLHVVVKASSGKTLSSGVVAVLRFKTPSEIEGDDVSKDFKLEHRAAVDQSEREAAGAGGMAGVVTVMKGPPPVIACFFYMH